MEFSNHAILIGALLVLLSIVVSSLSARTGAPLLLVFLGVGMLAGEEGPGHILFSDYQIAYLVGTMALAVWLWAQGDLTLGAIALTSGLTIRISTMSGWIMWTAINVFE